MGAGWYRPAPDNMGGFSAVCWMFGRRMQAHLGIPVGLIENQVGGTAVERWSSTAALSKCNQERGSRMGTCKASTAASEAQWLEQMEAAGFDRDRVSYSGVNSSLFNGMIAPWAPSSTGGTVSTAVRGAIWYQGESNVACSDVWPYSQGGNCAMGAADCAEYYSCQFPAMIADWRQLFQTQWSSTDIELTFLFVGLPAYVQDLPSTLYDGKNDSSLPLVRLAQRESGNASYPRNWQTSLVDHGYLFGVSDARARPYTDPPRSIECAWSNSDCGAAGQHYGSIHPMDKTPVGKRLMLSAREHAYGETDVVSSGPEPLKALAPSPGRLTLTFEPRTVGASGLLLRTSGAVRQVCPLGEKQVSGNPTNATVPASQCGCASGFDVGTAAEGFDCVGVATLKIGADKKSLTMRSPPRFADAAGRTLRYLFADWPTPTVYNAESFLGENGQLPTPPFTMGIKSDDAESALSAACTQVGAACVDTATGTVVRLDGVSRPVAWRTELAGCTSPSPAATDVQEARVSVTRRLVCGDSLYHRGRSEATVVDTFSAEPTTGATLWTTSVESSEPKHWTTDVATRLALPNASGLALWTGAWMGQRLDQRTSSLEPMPLADLHSPIGYSGGSVALPKGAAVPPVLAVSAGVNMTALPIITFLDSAVGHGFSAVQDPANHPLEAWIDCGGPCGQGLAWHRRWFRLGGGTPPVVLRQRLLAHGDDWRPAANLLLQTSPGKPTTASKRRCSAEKLGGLEAMKTSVGGQSSCCPTRG